MKNTGNLSKAKGNAAEDIACEHLINNGYIIIYRNYYSRYGEVDIIAEKGEYIVFIEVKYRKNTVYGVPSAAVGYGKQKKIIKTALTYVGENNITEKCFRFDIIEISGVKEIIINHIENAFY